MRVRVVETRSPRRRRAITRDFFPNRFFVCSCCCCCCCCSSIKKRKISTKKQQTLNDKLINKFFLNSLLLSLKTENAGKTAAMIAAGAGHVDVLKAMQRGPSMLDLKAADGGTPAMSAAVHGYKEVLDYLISKNVDLNAQDEDGWTALHFAVMANAASSVKALLAAGVRTDIKNSTGIPRRG